MAKITVNYKNHTLELSRKFADAAAKYGTEEYKELQEVRRDYPGYKVNVAKSKATKTDKEQDIFKGLNYDYMEKYIEAHDDDEKSIMAEYLDLRGKSDEAKELQAGSASFLEIRSWFLNTFPAIEAFYAKRAKILAKNSSNTARTAA